MVPKPVRFLGNSLDRLRKFPEGARQDAGYQLDRIQRGLRASDTRPMPTIGRGVEEIRIRDGAGSFRVVYAARFSDAIYVLHAFQKKTQATSRLDLELAKTRFSLLIRSRP